MLKAIQILQKVLATFGVGNADPANTGAGITFPAVQQPSSSLYTLDDYREGTWTPTVTAAAGAITSYTAQGSYTKIGNLVCATVIINITNKGTGLGALIASLPIAPAVISVSGSSLETAVVGLGGKAYVPNGDPNVYITDSVNGSYIQNGYNVIATVSYYSA